MASLQDNQRHQRHHDLCSCYSLLICCHPFSTTYIFFSKNHQSLISLYITSSLESIFLSHSASLAQNTPLMISHALIHLPPGSTCSPLSPSITHSLFHSRLKTHLFHKSFPPQSASTHLDCLLGLYRTGISLLNSFSFLLNFFIFFYFGSCGRLIWYPWNWISAQGVKKLQ